MLTPRLVVTMVSPETGRLRPTELDVLPEPLTAAEHGLMVGSPPPVDKRVHHGNWLAWPHIRWALRSGADAICEKRNSRLRDCGANANAMPSSAIMFMCIFRRF